MAAFASGAEELFGPVLGQLGGGVGEADEDVATLVAALEAEASPRGTGGSAGVSGRPGARKWIEGAGGAGAGAGEADVGSSRVAMAMVGELGAENAALRHNFEQLREAHARAVRDGEVAGERAAGAERERARAAEALARSEGECERLRGAVLSAEALERVKEGAAREAREAMRGEVDGMHVALGEAGQREVELRREVEAGRREVEALRARVARVEADKDVVRLEALVEGLEARNKALEREVAGLSKDRAHLEEREREASGRAERADVELRAARELRGVDADEKKRLSVATAALEKECAIYKGELDAARSERRAAEDRAGAAEAELVTLRAAKAGADQSMEAFAGRVAAVRSEVEAMHAAARAQLEAELAGVRAEMADAKDRLIGDFDKEREELLAREAQMTDSFRAAAAEADRELAELRRKLAEHEFHASVAAERARQQQGSWRVAYQRALRSRAEAGGEAVPPQAGRLVAELEVLETKCYKYKSYARELQDRNRVLLLSQASLEKRIASLSESRELVARERDELRLACETLPPQQMVFSPEAAAYAAMRGPHMDQLASIRERLDAWDASFDVNAMVSVALTS